MQAQGHELTHLCVLPVAEDPAVLVDAHLEGVRCVVDTRTPENFSEVEGLLIVHINAVAAEWEHIVLVWQLRAHGRERLDLYTQLIARLVVNGRDTRKEKPQ